jgi:hypothetical protein
MERRYLARWTAGLRLRLQIETVAGDAQKPMTPVTQSRMTTMPGTPINQSKSGMTGDSNAGSRVAPVPPVRLAGENRHLVVT